MGKNLVWGKEVRRLLVRDTTQRLQIELMKIAFRNMYASPLKSQPTSSTTSPTENESGSIDLDKPLEPNS